jgi:putative transposase
MRKIPFRNGEYYHIYNRGVDKRKIFNCKNDYLRFLKSLKEFNQINPIGSIYKKDRLPKKQTTRATVAVQQLLNDRLVEIISFNLLPNHFHLILKQTAEGGISEFMKRVNGGYTQFFNFHNQRNGFLFQGRFKSIHIDSNKYLLYLSAYINGNRNIHGLSEKESFCSLDYIDSGLVNLKIILDGFKSINEYKRFVKKISTEISQKREEIKRYALELE